MCIFTDNIDSAKEEKLKTSVPKMLKGKTLAEGIESLSGNSSWNLYFYVLFWCRVLTHENVNDKVSLYNDQNKKNIIY